MLVAALVGMSLLLAQPVAMAQVAPSPIIGPDGQPVSEPEYTPSPPVQPSPTATRQPGTPTPCRCEEGVQPLPRPSTFSIWWLILIPLYVIVMILMYKLGAAGRSQDRKATA